VSPHTQLAAAVLGAALTAAAAAYYAWWRGRELHREMDAVLDHLARFENNLIGEPGDPEGGELGRQARNLERLRLIVESEPPLPGHTEPFDGPEYGPQHDDAKRRDALLAEAQAGIAAYQAAHPDRPPDPKDDPPPPTARMPVVAALIPTTTGPATGPADIPPTNAHGDPPDQPSARAYSLTGPRPRPPGAHRRED
jgi:hypothetical protein